MSQILQASDRDEWFHCPGQQNLATSSLWWEGPDFLKLNPKEWPKIPCGSDLELDVAMKEQLKTQFKNTHAILTTENKLPPRLENIIDFDRHSNKGRILRTVAWVLRFVSNLKAAVSKGDINREQIASVSEISQAEMILIRSIQREAFAKEIRYLSSKEALKRNLKVPSYVSQFNLFLDESNILRCRSRLGK